MTEKMLLQDHHAAVLPGCHCPAEAQPGRCKPQPHPGVQGEGQDTILVTLNACYPNRQRCTVKDLVVHSMDNRQVI